MMTFSVTDRNRIEELFEVVSSLAEGNGKYPQQLIVCNFNEPQRIIIQNKHNTSLKQAELYFYKGRNGWCYCSQFGKKKGYPITDSFISRLESMSLYEAKELYTAERLDNFSKKFHVNLWETTRALLVSNPTRVKKYKDGLRTMGITQYIPPHEMKKIRSAINARKDLDYSYDSIKTSYQVLLKNSDTEYKGWFIARTAKTERVYMLINPTQVAFKVEKPIKSNNKEE